MATPAPGTIPSLPPYQPGALTITGQEAIEIVSTLNAAGAASFSMLITDAVGKAPSVMPNAVPSGNDIIAVYNVNTNLPYAARIANIAAAGGASLPTGGNTSYLLAKVSTTDFNANWFAISSFVTGTSGVSVLGTANLSVSLTSQPGLSVLGVAGSATAQPTAIIGAASQVLQVNSGGTGLSFATFTSVAAQAGLSVLGVAGTATAVPTAVIGTSGQFLQINAAGTGLLFAAGPSGVATAAGVSVLGVAGSASAIPTAIIGTSSQVLVVADNGTSLAFGPLNVGATAAVTGVLGVPFGGSGTSTLTANAVLIGSGTSTVGLATSGTPGRLLIDQGASIPLFTPVGGDITMSSAGTATIGAGAVSVSKMANAAASTILANPTAGAATPQFATTGAINAMLPVFGASGTTHVKGLVPDPGATAGVTRLLGEDATWHAARQILTTTMTYYVNGGTGNDSNPGTSGSPWRTTAFALNYVEQQLDFGGQAVIIQLQDYTAYPGIVMRPPVWQGGGSLTIQGNSTTVANTTISSGTSSCLVLGQGTIAGQLTVQNLKLTANTTGGTFNIFHNGAGALNVGNVEFGTSSNGHMWTGLPGAFIHLISGYAISGSSLFHMGSSGGGAIIGSGLPVAISGTPAFTQFVFGRGPSWIQYDGNTITGSGITGPQFNLSGNAVLFTNGAGTAYLPGIYTTSVATTGAQFI